MEKDQYNQIASFEKSNWWYCSRRDILDKIIGSQNRSFSSILDAGCGVGSHSEILLKYSRNIYGLDISSEALNFCSRRGYAALFNVDITDMSLGKEFDLIVCMDVIEHLHNDRLAIRKLKEHLSKDGILIMSVPAHMYLWNDNDEFSHHVKRYELKEMEQIVKGRGLNVLKIGYWNQFSYLPCLIFYLLKKLKRSRNKENNLQLIPDSLNNIFYRVLRVENLIFMKGALWQGVSVICLCKNH